MRENPTACLEGKLFSLKRKFQSVEILLHIPLCVSNERLFWLWIESFLHSHAADVLDAGARTTSFTFLFTPKRAVSGSVAPRDVIFVGNSRKSAICQNSIPAPKGRELACNPGGDYLSYRQPANAGRHSFVCLISLMWTFQIGSLLCIRARGHLDKCGRSSGTDNNLEGDIWREAGLGTLTYLSYAHLSDALW